MLKTQSAVCTLLLLSIFVQLGYADVSRIAIEESMSQDELDKSGLKKLSSTELKFLNSWLIEHFKNTNFEQYTTAPESNPAPALPPNEKNTVESDPTIAYEKAKAALNAPRELQIKGEFKGWSGDTYFFMTNGEIWQQRTNRRYFKKLDSPKVRIYKTRLGFFEMEVIETGKKVGVKKIQRD